MARNRARPAPRGWSARDARRRQREFWEAAFGQEPDRMGPNPSPMARYALRHVPRDGRGLRWIELGCGTGRDLVEFVRRGFTVAAIDVALPAVRASRRRSVAVERPDGVPRPIVDHGEAVEFLATQSDASAAFVYSNLFLTMGSPERHLSRLLREIARVLRPGGLHLFSVRSTDDAWFGRGRRLAPNVFDLGPEGPPVRFYDDAELRRRTRGAFERVTQRVGREGSGRFQRVVLYTIDRRRGAGGSDARVHIPEGSTPGR